MGTSGSLAIGATNYTGSGNARRCERLTSTPCWHSPRCSRNTDVPRGAAVIYPDRTNRRRESIYIGAAAMNTPVGRLFIIIALLGLLAMPSAALPNPLPAPQQQAQNKE